MSHKKCALFTVVNASSLVSPFSFVAWYAAAEPRPDKSKKRNNETVTYIVKQMKLVFIMVNCHRSSLHSMLGNHN